MGYKSLRLGELCLDLCLGSNLCCSLPLGMFSFNSRWHCCPLLRENESKGLLAQLVARMLRMVIA